MQRRKFTEVLGTGGLLASFSQAQNKSPDAVKVGVVTHAGGPHLDLYFTALADTQDCSSVVLSDPSGKSFKSARQILGTKLIATYSDLTEMLRSEKPQMTLVTMEAVSATEAIRMCLDANCHVLAEKPSCVNSADFELLTEKAHEKNLHLMLALANRLNPEIVEARRLIREGKIGQVYGLDAYLIADQTRLGRTSYQKSWWAKKARAGGGHLIWLGIHWLDLAMYITGLQVTEVAGFTGVVGGQPIDTEDSAAIAMKFSNGAFGTMTSGYYLDRRYHSQIKIWGSAGWLELQRWRGDMQEFPLEWYSTTEKEPKIHRFKNPGIPTGYTPLVKAAIRASTGLGDPPLTADDGLQVLKTIFSAYTAAETGRTQQIT
ncbi:MAG: oxidoreductase [Solibacterales bacterium]|nr:oxidoreductase [Bryobacterales bacterium]|tara:strand:- start:45175 stop:46296 length:1122 start_codon:yes stop_codon:yes gene_type:complete